MFTIWYKIQPVECDIILTEELMKIEINGTMIFSKIIKGVEDIEVYEELLDMLQDISKEQLKGNEEEYKKMSDKFLDKIKTLGG
jgi:tRNA(Phe) wybutosine-synthesizing methylase Tyw3